MTKTFILTVLSLTALFISGYLVWTTWVNPRPPVAVSDPSTTLRTGAPESSAAAKITPSANITIVPATLNQEGVPSKLGALALTQTITGTGALAEFSQLHGKGFDLVGGYRASYADAKNQATLWVGQAKEPNAAKEMVEQMAVKIGAGNAMFKDLQPLDIGGRMLYSVNGQGQEHFFYAVNDKIVWVAADSSQAFDVLHSLWSAVK